MRLLQLADLHLTDLFPEVVREDQQRALRQAAQEAIKHNCSHVVFLGDTIHDKKLIYINSLRLLEETIQETPELQFIIIIGNHDCVKNPKNHGFSTLSYLENVTIVDEEFRIVDSCKNELVFLPYSTTLSTQLETLTGTYLFSHFGVNEASVSPGVSVPHPIRFSHLLEFQRVFLGHFHLPQDLEYGSEQHLHYVGSTNSRNWNDKNQQKRFLILDSCKNEIEEILVKDTLQFHELFLTESDQEEKVLAERQQLVNSGAKVRIRSSIQLQEQCAGVIYTNYETADETTSIETAIFASTALLESWVKQHQKDLKVEIPADELFSVGVDFYKTADEQLSLED